jgi:hypothetical protein
MTENIIPDYLDLLDAQREATLAALDGLSEEQLWQRPAPKEWCIGEILSHTVRLYDSLLPIFKIVWKLLGWYGRRRRQRPYSIEIDNVYKRPGFPMWVGFLWKPRHTPQNPVPLAVLKADVQATHSRVRAFYTGKDEDVLGNIPVYDPAIGVVNLITALKVGIHHDQLHYDDVQEMAASIKVSDLKDRGG